MAADHSHTGLSWDFAHGDLRVSEDGRFLVHADGTPFFWLGDTAWELFHRLDREEAERYLENRRARGFTVIQAVCLAELDGLNTPNPYGQRPLIESDPARPDLEGGYWEHVDFIVARAREKGIAVGMLPTWGDKVRKEWGVGPVVFTPVNARAYGRFLGERYREAPNLVWILGGDRNPDGYEEIWRQMAAGLADGAATGAAARRVRAGGDREDPGHPGRPADAGRAAGAAGRRADRARTRMTKGRDAHV